MTDCCNNPSQNDGIVTFSCECCSPEHMVRVGMYDDWNGNMPEFYMQVTADNFMPWYKRVWAAIKFVFGYPTLKWHSVTLTYSDVRLLQEKIDEYQAKVKLAKDKFNS